MPRNQAAGSASIARMAGLSQLEVHGVLKSLCDLGLVEQAEGGWRLSELGRG